MRRRGATGPPTVTRAAALVAVPVALLFAVLFAATWGPPLLGQEAAGVARLEGVVWDSLAGRPLADAEVLVDGAPSATTAEDGTFSLEAPQGPTTVAFSHPDLPAWARPARGTELVLEEGRTSRVRLATPSAATVLDALCDGRGSLVGGLVRDLLTLVPVSAASVDARVDADAGGSSTQSTRATADGSFQLCLGGGAGVELRARLGAARSRSLTVRAEEGRVTVHDLFLQLSEPARLRGLVRDATTGRPLGDAAVRIAGTRLGTFTREDGRFTFHGVPPGSVSLSVELIGYGRRVTRLTAEGGARVDVTLDLFPEAVALDSMVVSVRGATAERVRTGTRYDGLDRPEIEKLLPRAIGFDDLLRNANVPGLRIKDVVVQEANGSRRPSICIETSRTSSFYSDSCQMVEVYLNDVRISEAETFLLTLDPASVERFRLLSRTEAGVQYGGTPRARNGVLLIWTRGR